jgi:hypothetical protein
LGRKIELTKKSSEAKMMSWNEEKVEMEIDTLRRAR